MSNVTTLKPSASADDRAFAAMKTLAVTLEQLKELSESAPDALRFYLMELDAAETQISLLRARLSMKRSTAHLCSQFGRPAP